MNSHLAALRENIIAETVAAYPDFHFLISTGTEGNLTADYLGTWEPQRMPDPHDTPYLTIEHDGERFLVSHYRWNDRKKYKTLKGAAKYVNGEVQASCDRRRAQKAKADAEKEHEERSIQLLRNFHALVTSHGITANLCLVADRYNYNHVCVDAARVNSRIDITVTSDYQLQMEFTYPRLYTIPETAMDILSVLSKKGTA